MSKSRKNLFLMTLVSLFALIIAVFFSSQAYPTEAFVNRGFIQGIDYTCDSVHFGMLDSDKSGLVNSGGVKPSDGIITEYTDNTGIVDQIEINNDYVYQFGKVLPAAYPNFNQFTLKVGKSETKGSFTIYLKRNIIACTVYAISYAEDQAAMTVNGQSVELLTAAVSPASRLDESKPAYFEPYFFEFDEPTTEITIESTYDKRNSHSAAIFYVADVSLRVSDVAPEYTKYTVNFDANGGTGSMESVQVREGRIYQIPTCTFTAPTGKEFDHWTIGGVEVGESITVTSDVTLVANWKDLPPAPEWYDATMTAGTGSSSLCKVNINNSIKDGIKVGSSSNGGDMRISIAAETTQVRFYIAAWNGEGHKTKTITISHGTLSVNSVSPEADSGISGSGSTYTLTEDESNYLVTIDVSNVTVSATITITSPAKNNRFVVWGAQYK